MTGGSKIIAGVMLCAAIAGCTTTAPNGTVSVHTDLGGNIAAKMREIVAINRAGTPYRIAGECVSTCTMYLGLEDVCVEPGARLGFHGPSWLYSVAGAPVMAYDMSEPDRRLYAAQMAQHYPEPIRTRLTEEWSLAPHQNEWLTGLEAHRMAPDEIRLCERNAT